MDKVLNNLLFIVENLNKYYLKEVNEKDKE